MLHQLAMVLALGGPYARVDRLPRIEGRADVRLWRDTQSLIFGASRRPVFVRATDAAAQRTLRGVGVDAPLGRWLLVQLDPGALLAVLGGDGELSLRAAPAHAPMLDRSVTEVGGHLVHAGIGLSGRRGGKGVLVGIVDTGIDLGHPAFRKSDGTSRVVAFWDQDAASGRAPPEFGYGHECRSRDIADGACDAGDPAGHGTHVAGIAAGNAGLAPEADIAVVRSETFTRLADAVWYLVQLAARRRQPLAINISVGGHYGAHDGATPLEGYLDDVVGNGRIIVAAAGNYGAGAVHLGVELGSQPVRAAIEALPFGSPVETAIELWSDPMTQVELSLELWSASEPVVVVPLAVHASELVDATLHLDGGLVLAASYGVEIDGGSACRTLVLDAAAGALPEGYTVALALRGHGRLDGWVSQSDYRYGQARFGTAARPGFVAGDGEMSVTVPATARSVIGVGSYSVRSQWVSEDSAVHALSPLTAFGALSPFSSRGPTRRPSHTGFKPDLAAPGSIIASARAGEVPPGPSTVDVDHMVMQGTSMAAPHVTGTVALMLEARGDLGPERVEDLLALSARQDRDTGAVPSPSWGSGKLDAAAAVRLAELEAGGGCAQAPGAWGWLVALAALRRRR